MRITYDPTVDAVYIEFRRLPPGKVETRELGPDLFGDFGADGKVAGIEVLDASEVLGDRLERLTVEVAPLLKAAVAAAGPRGRTLARKRTRKAPALAGA